MNAYDFDGTIYRGDSTIDYLLFCLIHQPRCLKGTPKAFQALLGYVCGRYSRDYAKQQCLLILKLVKNQDDLVGQFWDKHLQKMAPWYLHQMKTSDLWISASPTFLLAEPARRLGVGKVIATDVDQRSGLLLTQNCRGYEKVHRLRKEYPDSHINRFYSDSLSDEPMAKLAENAYLVRRKKVRPWPQA